MMTLAKLLLSKSELLMMLALFGPNK